MLTAFLNNHNKVINKERLDDEFKKLVGLSNGIYYKIKENKYGYYIKILVDKAKLNLQNNNIDIPDIINFLIIIDITYPDECPKILAKSKVYIILYIIL